MAGINLSSAKPTINISNGVGNKELSMGYVGTRDHTKLANLDYENSGHTGFQKELTFDTTPTADSTNPVTSGGVKTELDKKANGGDVNALILADERLKYYGDKDIVPSDESWFTVNGSTITGLSDKGKAEIGTEVVIPYKINGIDITSIGGYVFKDCTSLTSINIPNSVKDIGEYALHGCSLTSVYIPNSVKDINMYTFSECTALKEINLSDNIKNLYMNAFDSCTTLEEITIPKGVSFIANESFSNCTSLKTIKFENDSVSISDNAFSTYTKIDGEWTYVPLEGLTFYCEQGSTADTYAKANNIPIVYTDVKATSINPTVKTDIVDTIAVNTIYDLGVQTALSITLPSGQIGDFIQFDFISGETATTLTINSSSGLVGFDLIPGTNTIYTLYFDWGETGLDGTDVTYGWRFNYSEYSIDVA